MLREAKASIKGHAKSVSLITMSVAILLTFILPGVFDVAMMVLAFGCGWLLSKAQD